MCNRGRLTLRPCGARSCIATIVTTINRTPIRQFVSSPNHISGRCYSRQFLLSNFPSEVCAIRIMLVMLRMLTRVVRNDAMMLFMDHGNTPYIARARVEWDYLGQLY